jgi:hypothetical protein
MDKEMDRERWEVCNVMNNISFVGLDLLEVVVVVMSFDASVVLPNRKDTKVRYIHKAPSLSHNLLVRPGQVPWDHPSDFQPLSAFSFPRVDDRPTTALAP